MRRPLLFLRFLIVVLSIFAVPVTAQNHQHDGMHHWEIPSQDPDRIILTFYGDPSTQRAVTWRSDTTVTSAVAQIAEATVNSKFTEQAVSIKARTEPFNLGSYKENKPLLVLYHSVVFEGLKPDKLYAYRVGDVEENWS